MFTSTGVLNLVNEKVTINIEAPDDTVVWGIGNSDDVKAYVGDSAAVEIAGFENWDTAKIKEHEGKQETIASDKALGSKGAFDISPSDLWIKSGKGKDKAQVEYSSAQGPNRSLIVSTLNGKAPEVTLTWEKPQTVNGAIPWIFIGILLALIGGFLLIGDSQDRAQLKAIREGQIRRREQKTRFAEAQTSVLPAFKGDIASPETDREIQVRHTDRALGAIIVPGTLRADKWRSRQLQPQDRVVLPTEDSDDAATSSIVAGQQEDANSASSSAYEMADQNPNHKDSEEKQVKNEYWKSLWTFANGSEHDSAGESVNGTNSKSASGPGNGSENIDGSNSEKGGANNG
ncbi:hypothetical protein ACFPH7_02935 [Arcanobacterium bovis]|uniref:hypothetical protein n=1 Tax=Arcanobacterium bovis TaxID=2529275 RepID=UPI0010403FD3|nr:hypothetical protein [Arcanobacterium bovis]